MNRIITISREFGSGGREFGRRLSELLGFAYYDQEILQEIAKQTSLSEQYIQTITEHRPSFSYPIHIGRSFSSATNTMLDHFVQVLQAQNKIITEMAEKSDCVIVGRCANYILRDMKPLRLFIYSDLESKISRCRLKAPEGESLSDSELTQQIKKIDKGRARYYEACTGCTWGNRLDFDLCINTSNAVIRDLAAGFAELLKNIPKERGNT